MGQFPSGSQLEYISTLVWVMSRLGLLLCCCAALGSCASKGPTFNGITMGKAGVTKQRGPFSSSKKKNDGCPDEAMRCDDKCIVAEDNWNKPCHKKAPWGPCVEFQSPHYCAATDTCTSALEQCEGRCMPKSGSRPESFICGDQCGNMYVPCNGSCTTPSHYWAYNYVCGDRCVSQNEVKALKVCDGKCVDISTACKGKEEKIKATECIQGETFKCKDIYMCVALEDVCNGVKDCADGSDEECDDHCALGMRKCDGKFICNNEPCPGDAEGDIPAHLSCGAGFHVCEGKCQEEETPCNGVCPSDSLSHPCTNSLECISPRKLCNSAIDCTDGSDELEDNCKCKKDGMWNCSTCLPDYDFKCKDNTKCIHSEGLCDGRRAHCDDKSDEKDCEFDGPCPGMYRCDDKFICKNQPCNGTCWGTMCNGKCIDDDDPCGGICKDGRYGEKMKFCPKNNKCMHEVVFEDSCKDKCDENQRNSRHWMCNGECVSKSQACNGSCPKDKNFDMLCGDKCFSGPWMAVICNSTCVAREEYVQHYKNNSKWNRPCGDICPLGFKCKDGSACLTLGSECDGTPDCLDGSDEDPDFCNKCQKYEDRDCSAQDPRHYNPYLDRETYHCRTQQCRGYCVNKEFYKCGERCIHRTEFCPETNSCLLKESVPSYDQKRLDAERDDFSCGDRTCVNAKLLCNGVKDCKNGKDEEGCPDCSERHGTWFCGDTPQCKDTPCNINYNMEKEEERRGSYGVMGYDYMSG